MRLPKRAAAGDVAAGIGLLLLATGLAGLFGAWVALAVIGALLVAAAVAGVL